MLTAASFGGVACLPVWLLTAPAESWLLATAGLLLGALLAVGVLTVLRPFG